MKLKPLFDKVVVKQPEETEQIVGGIFLPSAAKEKQEIAVDRKSTRLNSSHRN